jgi:hypothetical protein
VLVEFLQAVAEVVLQMGMLQEDLVEQVVEETQVPLQVQE